MKKVKPQEDKFIDSVLRPSSWSDYIGQEKIKKNLIRMLSEIMLCDLIEKFLKKKSEII